MTERIVPVASPPWAARGRSTSIDARTMYVAVTMKMMRRTRTTSTSGVTLISEMRSSSSPPLVPATYAPPGRLSRNATAAWPRAVARDGAGDHLTHGVRALPGVLGDRAHHRCLEPLASCHRSRRAREVALEEPTREVVGAPEAAREEERGAQ